MATDGRGHCRGTAVERDRDQIEAEGLLEHLAGEKARRAYARMGVAVLPRARLHPGNELGDVVYRHRRMNEQDLGRYPDERYRREVDVGVETELAEQAGVDDQCAADHQDGVAVAGGFSDQRGSDIAARSRVVLDVERLTEDLRQLGRKQAGNHIDWPARRKRRNQSDRPLRIGGLPVGGACEDAGRQERGNPQPQTCRSNLTAPAQSARTFASRTTLPHFSISVFRRCSNSCGVFAAGTKPRLSSRSLTSGMAIICTMSLCQRSMISLGVPAGATMPVSVSLSRSGTPASTLVGTSGKDGERRVLSTAMPCSLPSFMLLIAGGSAVNAMGVWPPMVELIAKPAPLNGTVTRSSPYFCLSSSPARCGVEPVAGCAKLYLPGLAFTSATSSFMDFAGKSGLTEITLGEAATSVIGAKSFTGS